MIDPHSTRSKDRHRIRVLSLDGGGIYGLTTAIWLRRLCEENPRFLDGEDVDLFAGCSSGAINALMLAKHPRPREAVLAGELERFWTSPASFSNSRSLPRFLSYLGAAGWFSDLDLLGGLRGVFGDGSLGDLSHYVHISTFNWTGAGTPPKSRAGQAARRHWRPKFFGNIFPSDEDFEAPTAEVAYAAATPPTFRPLRNGLGDGASFNGNPSVSALAQVVRAYDVLPDGTVCVLRSKFKIHDLEDYEHVGKVLSRIALVSMGSGQVLPYYWAGNLDRGQLFGMLPSNPLSGVFWPPAAYILDAATEEAEFITKQLVGRRRALRINPPALGVPTIVASLWARNPWMRDVIIRRIYESTATQETREALDAARSFLAYDQGWNRP